MYYDEGLTLAQFLGFFLERLNVVTVLYFYIFVYPAGGVASGWYIGSLSYIWTHPTIHKQRGPSVFFSFYTSFFETFLVEIYPHSISFAPILYQYIWTHPTIKEHNKRRQIFSFQEKLKLSTQCTNISRFLKNIHT